MSDDGAYIRDVVKGLLNYGCSTEALWPYKEQKVVTKPTSAAYKNALTVKPLVASYQRVLDLGSMKIALAAGHPVIFVFLFLITLRPMQLLNLDGFLIQQKHLRYRRACSLCRWV